MDRIGCTLPDSDKYLGGEIQPTGTDALQMLNSVGPDKSSLQNHALAWTGGMKNRRGARKRERLRQHVALRLRARPLHPCE